MKARNLSLLILYLSVFFIGFMGCRPSKLTEKQPDIPNGGRALAIASSPIDDKKMILASETGGLFSSSDGGDSWLHVSRASTFRYQDVMFVPAQPTIVIAAADRDTRTVSGGGIYRSTDGGMRWNKVHMNAPSDCINDMAAFCLSFDPSNERLWAGTNCGLFYSDDLGFFWHYLSGTSNLPEGKIRAMVTPDADRMAVLVNNAVSVSYDGGRVWVTSSSGLPDNRIFAQQHNQLAVSPIDSRHLYYAFNYADSINNNALFYSRDFGINWREFVNRDWSARPPWVVLSRSALRGEDNKFDLYYSDGGHLINRREVLHSGIPLYETEEEITSDHVDPADLAIGKDGKTPILLVSDGGVHKTKNNGANWTMWGAGPNGGYNALQITEVTGQLTEDDGLADLYFGTQDNDIWASPDYGATWPNKKAAEGFYLNVPRKSLPPDQTTVTGVACSPCANFKSGGLLTSQSPWNNPSLPVKHSHPALIKPGMYVQQFQFSPDRWGLARSTARGGWVVVADSSEQAINLPLVVGPESNPIIYLATDKAGTTDDASNVGLRRVSGILPGSPIVQSEITGFGNIGFFPTAFAWYASFSVKPSDPNSIIVADISTDTVRKSADGGLSWNPDNNLTDLVTNFGEFKFNWDGNQSQISCFGFDPECTDHIMVGTQQAGIFQTFNNGRNWEKVEGSEKIPYISSFFFPKKGEVVISSYGRGLWKFRYNCRPPISALPPEYEWDGPAHWYLDQLTPLDNVIIDDTGLGCGFFFTRTGQIMDIEIDSNSGQVKEIFIDKGDFEGYGLQGQQLQIPVKVTQGKGGSGIIGTDKKLAKLVNGKTFIKGVYLDGDLYSGIILHDKDVRQEELPRIQPLRPHITLNVDGNLAIPLRDSKEIVVTGVGFDPKFPIEVVVDGKQRKLEKEPAFDEQGVFRFTLPPIFEIGSHTILVRQKTDKASIEDIAYVRYAVGDYAPKTKRE